MEIFLTKRAQSRLLAIQNNIRENWGESVSTAFQQRIQDFFEILKIFPELGSLELADKGIRGFQVAKQTRIFYRIKGKKIIILNFFEVRQDPKKRFE